ncbi:hypothetical protein QFC21_000334 [Naganishia friedmannii]|uniref:Uncharacterized protein n=1 Tax=Naganishia friedmannii TaxID=89922 RepID=A0ACC2WCB3_9TREE|nr:hypothetical protein QFC21_000334 [Naganishia friedmannii]
MSHEDSLRSSFLGSATPNHSKPGFAANPMEEMLNRLDEDNDIEPWESYDDDDKAMDWCSWRGLFNLGTIFLLLAGLICIFAVLPITTRIEADRKAADQENNTGWSYNLGGVNATGQIAARPRELIDPDTPIDVYQRTGFDGKSWSLAFSDEFNEDGRTFFEGDDPFWEGVDLHYHGALHTEGGALIITQTQEPIHGLNFKSGMLQSWNKICFWGSMYIEGKKLCHVHQLLALSTLALQSPYPYPVTTKWEVSGQVFGPSATLVELGILAPLMAYTYDSCDTGILPNQTWLNGTGPWAAINSGGGGSTLSYLPGHRWSSCTCHGYENEHPGPNITKKLTCHAPEGRNVPEIDVIEAQIEVAKATGQVSQSFQVAPFNGYYKVDNTSLAVFDETISSMNSYWGGQYQQAASFLTDVDNDYYRDNSDEYGIFGVESYANENTRGDNYITWVANGKPSWTLPAEAIGPDTGADIGQRLISEEPMYMIMNFGELFGVIRKHCGF